MSSVRHRPSDLRSSNLQPPRRTCARACIAILLLAAACHTPPPGLQIGDDHVPITGLDVAAATAMLQGQARIVGTAVAKERDTPWTGINLSTGHDAQPGTVVMLFPRTRYFDEYLALREEYGARAQISAEAFALRREVRVGDEGAFEVADLGPGEFYLEAVVAYVQETAEDVQTGVQYTTIQGSNPHYSWQHVEETPIYTTVYGSYLASRLVQGFVTIGPEDDVVHVKLRN